MKVQIVMDRSGDTRHEFDATDSIQLADAKARFLSLTAEGFTAVALGREGEPGILMREFDPNTEQTLFIPRLQGG